MKAYTDPRDATFAELFEIACSNPDVILLTADTGAFIFKDFQKEIPDQFYNVGIAEQNAMSVAAGLALTGKSVFVFGISSFVTYRCYEQIKIDIVSMHLPVTILGMGTGYGYASDGPTHHVTQDISIMRSLPGMTIWSPSDCTMTAAAVHLAYESRSPNYIRIDKGPFIPLYSPEKFDFSPGLAEVLPGKDLAILATAPMVTQALKAVELLKQKNIQAGVVDVYRLKPANEKLITEIIQKYPAVVTLEEHTLPGGFGGMIAEIICDHGICKPMLRLGIPDTTRLELGSREFVREIEHLHLNGVVDSIVDWKK